MEVETHRAKKRDIRVLTILGCIGVTLFLALSFTYYTNTKIPDVKIPSPKMPNQNAFDTFNLATTLMLDDKKIGDAVSTVRTLKTHLQPYTLEEKEALIIENKPCLKLLRQGLTEEYMNPPARSFDAFFPYYSKFRGMARLLALEAKMKEAKKDWNGAIQSRIDCVALGSKVPRGGPLIGGLVGIAIQAIGMRDMSIDIEHLDKAQARAALTRIQSIYGNKVSYEETLLEEKWCVLGSLTEIFRKVHSPADWNNVYRSIGVSSDGRGQLISYLRFMTTSKAQILANFSKYMDQEIAYSKQPYSFPMKNPPIPSDPVCQALLPVAKEARMKWLTIASNQRLLTTLLALHLYRLDRGSYPAKLSDLIPGYLNTPPNDPFSNNKMLGYRRDGDRIVLYSIGPDAVDDGGKPVDDPSKANPKYPNSRARYYVDETSKGDIVAGKNAL